MILDSADKLKDEIRDYFTSDEYAKHARVWVKYRFWIFKKVAACYAAYLCIRSFRISCM